MFVGSDRDADGSECAGHTSEGTVVVWVGLTQQREMAKTSVDAETRVQRPYVSSDNSAQATRTPPSMYSDTPRTASRTAPPAAAAAAKKKRGRPKGSKNKPHKKQSSEQYEEVEQQVVEAPAGNYNTRRARRINYARLDDPFSSE